MRVLQGLLRGILGVKTIAHMSSIRLAGDMMPSGFRAGWGGVRV